jgi:uroporphyrinogen decarboxylase
MTKRDVVIDALEFRRPAYVPWEIGLTIDCRERLKAHLGTEDLSEFLDNHFVTVGSEIGRFEPVGENHVRDLYGVVWDRTVDKDIGTPCDWPIKQPGDLDRYTWPDAEDESWYAEIPETLAAHPGRFSRYGLGFSLYERAWTMRGMANLLMDMVERPAFVEEFLDAIVEHNLVQVRRALELGVDCLHFGDDYGMQTGLIMGLGHWRRFFQPRLAAMFEPVVQAGKYVSLHSCGRVQELFDELVEIGLNLFNPFQPEVMDVFEYMPRYRGRLAFHGGMSVQKTLPFGSVEEVREMTSRLIEAGRKGGYIFAPSHDVPRDVPPENLVAMMEVLQAQDGRAQNK